MSPDCRYCRWSEQRAGCRWRPVLWCAWRERACDFACDLFTYEPGSMG